MIAQLLEITGLAGVARTRRGDGLLESASKMGLPTDGPQMKLAVLETVYGVSPAAIQRLSEEIKSEQARLEETALEVVHQADALPGSRSLHEVATPLLEAWSKHVKEASEEGLRADFARILLLEAPRSR